MQATATTSSSSLLSHQADYLHILVCPHTRSDLRALRPEELNVINTEIQAGARFHFEGSALDQRLEDGLISADGRYVYRIQEGVIILLKNLAIVAEDDVADEDAGGLMSDKKSVQDFYNQFGWKQNDAGNFVDGDAYEDLRPVSQEYMYDCNIRIKRYLQQQGDYLLDAASGPIQFDEYLEQSKHYRYRLCVDLSFLALQEARKKLGDRGIYLVTDMTDLPLKENVVDGVVSINTLYHIPKDEQINAFREMYRVMKPGSSGILIYSWGRRSHLNNFLVLPQKVWRKVKTFFQRAAKYSGYDPDLLYFHAHPRSYFTKERLGFEPDLKVWRLISVPVQKFWIHGALGGKAILRWIYRLEDRKPEWCGKVGEYPMFVFKK
ncbi:MAG: class I SAM-dependent methyltransferase [Bacteroidia bacterium]